MKKTPTGKIRAALWANQLERYLSSRNDYSGKLSDSDFIENYYYFFENYSKQKSKLPLHLRSKLVLCTGDIVENPNDSDEGHVEHNLYDNDLPFGSTHKEFTRPTLSKWRNAKTVPNKMIKQISKQLDFSSSEWFDNNLYKNRLTRLLHVMDAAVLTGNLNQKDESLNKLKIILNMISKEWRPVQRNDYKNGKKSRVYDFYIPGPEERKCQLNIKPSEDEISKMDYKMSMLYDMREGMPWNKFESIIKEDFDLSLCEKSYCGLSLSQSIVESYNPQKPYSAYFTMISLMVSDELSGSASDFDADLILDLCSMSICVYILSRNLPGTIYDPNQFKEMVLIKGLPSTFISFFFDIFDKLEMNQMPWKLDEYDHFMNVYQMMYDIRDSCISLRRSDSQLRESLLTNWQGNKEGFYQPLGQNYHYPLFERCSSLKNSFDASLNKLFYDFKPEIFVPVFSEIFNKKFNEFEYSLFNNSNDLIFENHGISHDCVSVFGFEV